MTRIEKVATEVRIEMVEVTIPQVVGAYEEAFLRRCLEKLAAQDVEPVAWVCWLENDDGAGWKITVGSKKPACSNDPEDFKVYTEAQLIAAQQRTAEACAKVCESIDAAASSNPPVLCAMNIRNEKWRDYL